MRFIADGPSIPDELLFARDQGRVIFFCGAGVSVAKAKLPDFFGLAKSVTRSLGVKPDDPTMKIIAEMADIPKRTGVEGLISADRVFGWLERDFQSRDIEAAVSSALITSEDLDISAHKTLTRLATTPEGNVRLVTTNFDRLFERCRPNTPTFVPPELPHPEHSGGFNGIVYLHGRLNDNGDYAENGGFILSSSDFGRAYLSDGWATTFVKTLIDRYLIVFVGYSADDPPMYYLLEALKRSNKSRGAVFAFQAGDELYANSRWSHKGVTPIPYDSSKGHAALWNTLDEWAVRADDHVSWTAKIASMAATGPSTLKPHERGQVVHVVSSLDGLRKFTEARPVPPASWLCVFDPHRRFATPGHIGRWSESEDRPFVDPFELYGLDSDPIPEKVNPDEPNARREVPRDVYDAFRLNSRDHAGLLDVNIGSFRGRPAQLAPRLPARLDQLGMWLTQVSDQPMAVWWASHQPGLFPSLRESIEWHLGRLESPEVAVVRNAWAYLFDFWEEPELPTAYSWTQFARQTALGGWGDMSTRRFAQLARPSLKVEGTYENTAALPAQKEWRLRDLVRIDVVYPPRPRNLSCPDNVLAQLVSAIRSALEAAVDLEAELGGYGISGLSPIIPDEREGIDHFPRNRGLSSWMLYYIDQLKRLMEIDLKAARTEVSRWRRDRWPLFDRLRIWALGRPELVPKRGFNRALKELNTEAFWSLDHSRDLLLALSARWNGLSLRSRQLVELRIMAGPPSWDGEDAERFSERRAWTVANRLMWLHNQGCELVLDFGSVIAKLRADAPSWQPEFAERAAESLEGRSGYVRTETDHSKLDGIPIKEILARAVELTKRDGDYFVEYAPFTGLAIARPMRALAALRAEAKSGRFPAWAWDAFLSADQRSEDSARLKTLLAEQIARYDAASIADILRPVSAWLQKTAKTLADGNPDCFQRVVAVLTAVLAQHSAAGATAIVRGDREPDWTMEAINSPTGHVATAVLAPSVLEGLLVGQGLPKTCSHQCEVLLALPGDLRRHALVILSHRLSWFFAVDPDWTNTNLMSVLDGESEADKQALWAGFLWGGRAEGIDFFYKIKSHLLKMAASKQLYRGEHKRVITNLLLSAWHITNQNGDKWVTDDELRVLIIDSDDDLRLNILWSAGHYSVHNPDIWAPLLVKLLRDVWPRHLSARSGRISSQLCDILFSSSLRFMDIYAQALPLLTTIDPQSFNLPELGEDGDEIIKKYPVETLEVLFKVLPDAAGTWPYGINNTLEKLSSASEETRTDSRMVELKRRWDAR